MKVIASAVAVIMTAGIVAAVARRPEKVPQPVRLRSTEAPPAVSSLKLQLLAAESTYWRGEYDSARVAWRALLDDDDVVADSGVVADIKTWLGMAAWRQGSYDDAERIGRQALELKLRRGYRQSVARSYNSLGLTAWSQGRLTSALDLFKQGAATSAESDDPAIRAKLAANVALVQIELAEFVPARSGFVRARDLARAAGDKRVEGNALTNLGMLEVQVDEAGSAITHLQQARQVYRAAEYPTGEQNALGQLSTAYAALGDFQRAFAALDSANAIAGRLGLKQEIASNLVVLGDLYRDAGDQRKALQSYLKAQELNRELGLEIERGTMLRKAAVVQHALGATTSSASSVRDAIAIHARTAARFEELKDRLFLADIDRHETSAQINRGAAIASTINTPTARTLVALAAARVAAETAQPARVLELLHEDSADIIRAGFESEAEAAGLRAAALAARHNGPAAEQAAGAASDALERARASIGSGLLRASFVAQHAPLYASLMRTELALGHETEAFRVAEMARARDVGRVAGESDAMRVVLRRLNGLTEKLSALEADVANGGDADDERARELKQELTRARAEYESLLARSDWRQRHTEVADPRRIMASLKPGEVLIEYFMSGNDVLGFALTRNSLRGLKLPVNAATLLTRIKLARESLRPDRAADNDILAAVHNALVEPFATEMRGATRLVVVPHGAISYFPFAAMYDAAAKRYLIERYAVAYVPSATQLVELRKLAAPVTPRAVVMEPFPGDLPGTRVEARAVRRSWHGSRILKAGDATSTALRAAINTNAIVHVSSHAAMNPQTPFFSYVSLARAAGSDGRFEIHDVFSEQVRSPLVFLSGCETGLGSASSTGYQTGDDVATFANAFLFAGARAVVSTVWRIEDESAAELAGRFYRGLHGRDAADALARAQRSMLRSSKYRAPFYWAPYVLTGDVTL